MTQTQAEAALAELEAPFIEEMNARADLATIEALIATTPHAGARKALEADLPAAQQRVHDAAAGVAKHTATQAAIDAAAQKVIDEREPVEPTEPEAEEG